MLKKINSYWQRSYAVTTLLAFIFGIIFSILVMEVASLPKLEKAQTFYGALVALVAALITAYAATFSARYKEKKVDERASNELSARHIRAASTLALFARRQIEAIRNDANKMLQASLSELRFNEFAPKSINFIPSDSIFFSFIPDLPPRAVSYFLSLEDSCHEINQAMQGLAARLGIHVDDFEESSDQRLSPSQESKLHSDTCNDIQGTKLDFYADLVSAIENFLFVHMIMIEISKTGGQPSEEAIIHDIGARSYLRSEKFFSEPITAG